MLMDLFRFGGSSPRVWGQDLKCFRHNQNVRIIPTRMGTSLSLMQKLPYHEDHPHAYGDKKGMRLFCLVYLGSSPRVWGQVIMESVKKTYTGIIPTRMGTSLPPYGLCRSFRDHPHAYGDKKTNTVASLTKLGSSPRVWGQVKLPRMFSNANRIIPTRMGTS